MPVEFSKIISVSHMPTAGRYNVVVEYVGEEEGTFQGPWGYNPTDPYAAPAMKAAVESWVAQGKPIAAYVPPTPAEQRAAMPVLSARRLRLGLIANGIMPSQVQTALEAMPAGVDREKALVEWEYASDFERLHHLILTVGAALGLTPEQIDTMWMASQNL
jgi:hypothetical protein